VTLVHRRERFRAHEYSLTRLRELSVRILTSTEIAALRGDGRVQDVEVVHGPTQRVERIATDSMIAALEFVAALGPPAESGVELQAKRIAVSTAMATNLPRVFAAGDVTAYPGKVRLIAVGFGEMALAVNNAAVLIDPSSSLYPGHSTDAA
jgi:thioredoxin reductase (NADPH)